MEARGRGRTFETGFWRRLGEREASRVKEAPTLGGRGVFSAEASGLCEGGCRAERGVDSDCG